MIGCKTTSEIFNVNSLIIKPLLILLLLIAQLAFAENDTAEYMDNGLPKYYELMDGKTPVSIEFTDVIEGRYIVDVEWFPNWGLVPMFNGHANINFKLVDRNVKFTIKADLFHIGRQFINASKLRSKEPIKLQFSNLIIEPFDFRDMNFDGIKELVIRNSNGGQRGYDSYSVYLIQETEDSSYFNVLDLSDVEPYSAFDETTVFDWDNQRVEMYYSRGACSSIDELYERVYSKYPLKDYSFKLIERLERDYQDEDGNYIGCHRYYYNIVDGKKILDEARSGPVD